MKRTQIYLTAEEHESLERLSHETGRTRSQLIRAAIDAVYLGQGDRAAVLRALEDSADSWQRDEGGEEYVERLRSGRLAQVHSAT